MTGHRSFSELKDGWSPSRHARNRARKAELGLETTMLEELRINLHLSPEEFARRLTGLEPALSRRVGRGDMRISRLRDLIEALGGELHVTAMFPDRSVDLADLT